MSDHLRENIIFFKKTLDKIKDKEDFYYLLYTALFILFQMASFSHNESFISFVSKIRNNADYKRYIIEEINNEKIHYTKKGLLMKFKAVFID